MGNESFPSENVRGLDFQPKVGDLFDDGRAICTTDNGANNPPGILRHPNHGETK
ncbi:MAG: hypothetical protein JWS12_262 [Candidatus Saccharibacteria bacterium]|nr:hypothetical protein [Candidatus Saccharibacteria bacterium]